MKGRNGGAAPAERRTWQVWIDTGGTFTDCIALDPGGRRRRAKVLSTSALRGVVEAAAGPARLRVGGLPELPAGFLRGFRFRLLASPHHPERRVAASDAGPALLELDGALPGPPAPGAAFEVLSSEEAPVLAARLATGTPPPEPLPPIAMRLGTTRGTNALLERRGSAVALFITRGLGDLLEIGTQARPDLFALAIRKPVPLPAAVVEVEERIAAGGAVVVPLRLEPLAAEAARLLRQGVRVAAVALANSFVNPRHEEDVARFLRTQGFEHVSTSARLAPLIKLLPRAETAVVNAYLARVIDEYLGRVEASIGSGALHVMTSAGGLVRAGAFAPRDSLLSGPAGGVGGAALAARLSGFGKAITFDMGGTSTDAARWDGDFEYVFEHEVGGARLVAPALAVESVAAGGGSICRFDGAGLRVGPESAGAAPGPACYGAGGPLTLTDVNLLLGRLDPARFEVPVDPGPAERELAALREAIRQATGEEVERDALLEGLLDIANERMADAIRRISLRRGYDPQAYTLVAFGGAGGQHACAVAERLGIETVLVPEDAGLLSALGLGGALLERFAERQVLRRLDDVREEVAGWYEELAREAGEALAAEGVAREEVIVRRRLAALRLQGQETALAVDHDDRVPLEALFAARYEETYGHAPEGRALELESLRAVVSTRPGAVARAGAPAAAPASFAARPARRRHARLGGEWREAPVLERSRLEPGARFHGPALVVEAHSATVVGEGWEGEVDGVGALVLRRGGKTEEKEGKKDSPRRTRRTRRRGEEGEGREGKEKNGDGDQRTMTRRARAAPEAVARELYANRFGAIAEEMGEMLRRTALSTNVKERLDFSCALLDPGGELVANAPHIPVHLGALGLCVRSVRAALPLEPGDVAVTNHPAFGGSHLPDVTVITPIHTPSGELLGYAASRAHHAEIGGTRPGSMPPEATRLVEEGVVIPPLHLVRGGKARWDSVRRLLEEAPCPSRAVPENLADLRAAVAANHRGATALRALAMAPEPQAADPAAGPAAIRRAMDDLRRRAAERAGAALARLPPGRHEAEELLDDGTRLRVAIEINGGRAVLDFAGTAGVHPGNLNATPAIVRSVVVYVLRLLVDEPLPLNEGLLRPVEIRLPPGILDPPFPDDPALAPAVVGGNVETSQRLTDLILKALGIAAASQGTMNNVLFGTGSFSYYETVCGGAGAGPGFDGASAVHTHMTNTRITDVEVLEHRYPARVERFAVRRGAGGTGRWRGGDGVVRELRFLAPVSLSVLAERRRSGPFGLAGGGPGLAGRARLLRASGEVVELGSRASAEVEAGDRFLLETPGGGGYGAREQ